jgi:hypothetical protein
LGIACKITVLVSKRRGRGDGGWTTRKWGKKTGSFVLQASQDVSSIWWVFPTQSLILRGVFPHGCLTLAFRAFKQHTPL